MLPGIDISIYQWPKGIPFSMLRKLKKAGFEHIHCRASIGLYPDPSALTTVKRVRDAGLVPGMYHFLDDGPTGAHQAEVFWGQVQRAGGPRGIILTNDVEATAGNHPSRIQMSMWAQRMGTLAGANIPLVLYSNRSTAISLGNPDAGAFYDHLWQAFWTQSEHLGPWDDSNGNHHPGGWTLPAHAPHAGFFGFRKAELWQYGALHVRPARTWPPHVHVSGRDAHPAIATKRHDISVDGDAFDGTRAELEAWAEPRMLPIPKRPNYALGYNAFLNWASPAVQGVIVPPGPNGPAYPAGVDASRVDVLEAIDSLRMS